MSQNLIFTPQCFLVDGATYASLNMPCKSTWLTLAHQKGFDLIARAVDRYNAIVRCHTCYALSVVRINVLRDHKLLCHPCIKARRTNAASAFGAQLLVPDPENRHYGYLRLACGHTVRSQYTRIERAAAGGHSVGCVTCRTKRDGAVASKFGWTLLGAAERHRPSYRSYEHTCGHKQDIMVGNMLWGDCTCARCGKGWSAQKSFIYLFQIALPKLTVLKLGFSARPQKRLRHQLGLAKSVAAKMLRVIPLPSGHVAVGAETEAHAVMRTSYPDLVMPKSVFGDAINTQGEIYHPGALDILQTLIDGIAARYAQTDVADPQSISLS